LKKGCATNSSKGYHNLTQPRISAFLFEGQPTEAKALVDSVLG